MNKNRHLLVSLWGATLMISFILSMQPAPLESPELPKKPLQIRDWNSRVDVESLMWTGGVFNILHCSVNLWIGDNPVRTAQVRVDNRYDLTYQEEGLYSGQFQPYDVYANRPITIAIKPKPLFPLKEAKDEGLVTAQGTITHIIVIELPCPDEVINLAAVDFITVRWRFTAGSGPVWIGVTESPFPGPTVFSRTGISGNTININKSYFKANHQYLIKVGKNLRDFDLKGNVTSDSHIKGSFYAKVTISTR